MEAAVPETPPNRTTFSLPESQDQYDITIKSPESHEERTARLQRETLELEHRLRRERFVTRLVGVLLTVMFVYGLVVIALPDTTVEAKALAERALIALVTGFTGYLVGRRTG
jgi:hypothetical protein